MKPQSQVMTQRGFAERVRRGLFEAGLLSALFALYYATRGIAAGKESTAVAHARAVMDIERRIGIFHEMTVQGWVISEPYLVHFLNFVYAYTHMAALILFAIWLFIRHADQYVKYRNVFLGVLGTGLLVYVLYPLAPPRFFPMSGFVDTLSLFSGINYDQPSVATFYNPFAAMPSLHCAFALFVGIGLIRLGRSLAHYILGVGFPIVMVLAVVGTGNHYFLDALAGFTLTILAYLIVPRIMDLWDRWRHGSQERVRNRAGRAAVTARD